MEWQLIQKMYTDLELFCDITNSYINDIIDEAKLIRLILADRGLFKAVPYNSKNILY